MNYLCGRLITAKYIIFNRVIRLSFEANLAFHCIMVILAKIQLAFELFLQNRDFYKVCN